ncbi:MAG TPA: alpha-amylase family glycosyl hydrolase [Acidobacteriaceae bacterium]|nr:alpha-amylase family glycosyl hydrolase [Acidobacteriaceae bacterium]
MLRPWRSFALILLMLLATAAAWSQLQQEHACAAAPVGGAPCVYQVDPPGWWTAMPSPMVLLYGRNLGGAQISVSGNRVAVARTQFSASGHYAFLWLSSGTAAPQTVNISVATAGGRTVIPFLFAKRQMSGGFQGFSPADVMYLIMTDRFADGDLANDPHPSQRNQPRGWHGGDFRGVQQHLDYLRQLGVTTVWLTPVYDNSGEYQAYHGYSATDMYRTDPHFGSLADLQSLAQALHARGMKLVLDTVPNHVGASNPWVFDPPAPGWFHGTRADHFPATGNFAYLMDPHATTQQRARITDGWFANFLPDLNQENPLVRQYLIQNVIWWVQSTGADGLRYDTFPYVGRAFWQSLNAELHILYPQLTTVGEIYNPSPVITSFFAGGVAREGIDTGLSTPFDFPLCFALRAALSHHGSVAGGPVRHDDLRALDEVLSEDWLYPHPERLVTFFGNHDMGRFLSQPGVGVGDLKLAFALLATLRGMPEIYSGDEIAMRGGPDPDNRQDFPGGFPGDPQNAFTAAGRTPEQAAVHDWVAALFQFREHHPALYNGRQQDLFTDPSAFIFVRTPDVRHGCTRGGDQRFLIAVNDADTSRTLTIPTKRTALEGCSGFRAELGTGNATAAETQLTVSIPAKQAVIFETK